MISSSKPIKNSQQCQYYLEMTQSDYYANRYEKPGYWAGKGTPFLGLSGAVDGTHLQNLFDGFSPDGKSKLVQNAGSPNRQKGLDLVPAPDKSVSTYWAMADPEEHHIIQREHDDAVQAVADFFQENAAFTRRGKGGARVEQVGLVIACFTHCTSRALDPQLHTHMVILNIGIRSDGTTGALHNHELFELRKQADMVYQTHFALGLRMHLGLSLEANGQAFRIAGVPKEVCEFFSKRRSEILEYMKVHDLVGAAGASAAALETRPKKQHVAQKELFKMWHRVGNSLGWGPEQARELTQNKQVQRIMSRIPEPMASEPYSGPSSQPQRERTAGLNDDEVGVQYQNWKWEKADPNQKQSEWHRTQSVPNGEDDTHSERSQAKTFKRVSKNCYQLNHRRWGNILWRVNLGIVEIRVQMRKALPQAPGLNPASKIEFPAVRIVPWKISLFDSVPAHKRPKPRVLWKKSFLFAELRLQEQQVAPNTPAWSPGQKVKLPRLKFGWKSSNSTTSNDKKKDFNEREHQNSHSH